MSKRIVATLKTAGMLLFIPILILMSMLAHALAQNTQDEAVRPGCDACRFRIESLEQPFDLRGMWLFTRDDRPENKEANLDTRDWKLLKTPGPWRKAYDDGKNYSVGWYRATLEFAPHLMGSEAMLLLDTHTVQSDIYLDGQSVFHRPGDANIERMFALQPIPIHFHVTQRQYQLAIRIETPLMRGITQLPLELRRYVPNDPAITWHQLRGNELRLIVTTIGFTFGLFLLLVFAHTRYGMYLHAALSSLLCGLYFLASNEVFLRFASPEAGNILIHLGMNFCYFLYRFAQYFHVSTPRLNRWFAVLLLLVSMPLALMLIHLDADLLQPLRAIHHVLVLVVGAPTLYMVAQGARQGRAGARILLLGFTLSFAFGLNDVLLALGVIDSMLLMPLGVCAGLGAMLYVTSNSFATIFSEKKKLLATLQEKNTALQTQQERVSFILNMVPDLFTVSRLADGHIVTVNEGFTRLSGWPAEEVIGRNANELGLWQPEARKNFVRKLAEVGSLSDFESTFTTKDGRQIPGLVSARTFAIDGEIHIAMNVRDISDSRKQEDALRRSYDLLAKIQQNAGMGIWQWNLDSGEIWVSQKVCDILRLSVQATTNLPPGFVGTVRAQDSIAMVHPDDRERYIQEFGTGLRTRQVRSYQYRAICGDGVVRVLYTEGFLEFNETGRILHFYGFLQDITERVAAEQALRASQEKLSAIYNAIPDQIAVTRFRDAVVIDINEESARAYGRTRAEMLGISFADSDFWNDKSDYQRLADILVKTGKVDAFECTVRSHTGECYRGSISSRLFAIADEMHVISICRDVTELYRKQTELQRSYDMMAEIQQHAGMGIWRWNPETDEVLCSKTAFDLYHYTPQPDGDLPPGFSGRITGKQTLDFVFADDWEHYLDSISVLLQDKQPRILNYRIRRGDGMLRTLHSESHAEVDANGKVPFLYGFIKDITEEQRVAEELEQYRNHLETLVKKRTTELQKANQSLRAATAAAEAAQHAAEAANRMKSDFLAMISHEIRTPLGGVIGMLKLGLKDSRLVAETRDKFSLGLSNAQSLLQIINDILDYSKLEAGKMALEHIDFDLPAVLQDSHSILEERADAKGLALTMELPADLPRWWQGDPVRLRQVLINLMGNAIKFTEHGSVRLRLQRGEDDWLEFSVADTGVGIPEEAVPRLFQKFEQADVSTTRKFGGTGLGLAICKHIVEAMGGTIGVTSTLGAGTSFRFRLPLQEGTKPESVATIASSRHTHRLSILCAEDGKTNQLIVRELVEGMGHRIDLAENGLEAVRALSMRHYDMVLMDMRMPEMDGMEATQLIRAGGNERYIVLDPSLPIVALTANVMEEDRKRYLQAGMDGFLGKPIDEAALFGELAKVITRLVAQGATLPPLAGADNTPAQTADVATLDAMFGVGDTATVPPPALPSTPPDPVAAVQAVLSTRQNVSKRTWNAMIEVFRSEAPQRLTRLKAALDAGDAANAALELHTLKGSAAYLQGQEVRALCATLETLAHQNDLAGVARRYAELEQTLHAMLDSLQPH